MSVTEATRTIAIGDKTPILAMMTARVAPYGPNGEPSAYRRKPVEGSIAIHVSGPEGDEHHVESPSRSVFDTALHHYPHDHYAAFAAEQPRLEPLLRDYGAFAENISTEGWTEDDVCLGDRYRFGTAEIELSQGRTPCWKLGYRFGDPKMVEAVVKTRRSGWYYRVVKTGHVEVGDELELLGRPHPQWPISRAFGLVVAGDDDRDALEELVELKVLGASWRREGNLRLGRRV